VHQLKFTFRIPLLIRVKARENNARAFRFTCAKCGLHRLKRQVSTPKMESKCLALLFRGRWSANNDIQRLNYFSWLSLWWFLKYLWRRMPHHPNRLRISCNPIHQSSYYLKAGKKESDLMWNSNLETCNRLRQSPWVPSITKWILFLSSISESTPIFYFQCFAMAASLMVKFLALRIHHGAKVRLKLPFPMCVLFCVFSANALWRFSRSPFYVNPTMYIYAKK